MICGAAGTLTKLVLYRLGLLVSVLAGWFVMDLLFYLFICLGKMCGKEIRKKRKGFLYGNE